MRLAGRALIVVALAVPLLVGTTAAKEGWMRVLGTGRGCWAPRCAPGEWPMALPLVVHEGRLLAFGEGGAEGLLYTSDDGMKWTAARHDASWGTRYGAGTVSFRGMVWRMAGFEDGPTRVSRNDIWRSSDGRRWERVVERAPWPERVRPHVVVFANELWLIGGVAADSVVWRSKDGIAWRPVRSVPASAADAQVVTVAAGRMWLIGGSAQSNDVWSSTDGVRWQRALARAPWPHRQALGGGTLRDGILVVFGGVDHNDTWRSDDGITWTQVSGLVKWSPRAANYAVHWRNGITLFGGKTGRSEDGFADDVWVIR